MSLAGGQISCTHTLAASGDTILTLNNPNAPFARWEGDSNPPVPPSSTTPSPVTFRVSSRHLIDASSVFKAALTGPCKEASSAADSSTADACHEISADDWDVEAMRVVLSLLHSRTRHIPRTVTLEVLSKIAILVDYYALHEALHFFASLWIGHLRQRLPIIYNRDLMLWIYVSWVFKNEAIFKTVTKLAIELSPGKLAKCHLPIPETVITRIGVQRQYAMQQIGSSLRNLKLDLLNGKFGCSFECRSLLLGALIKHMHDDGFLEDGVTTAVKGRSLRVTIQRVREMQSPSGDWHRHLPLSSGLDGSCQFSLSDLTEPYLNKALKSITGLGFYGQQTIRKGLYNHTKFIG